MFALDDLLGAPAPLGKPLGRRPFNTLSNLLTRKPHRFLPPSVTELRIGADRESGRLMREAFDDVVAASGPTGLLALRTIIERPQIRAAGRPLGSGLRDYTFCSAISDGGAIWCVGVLTVRVRAHPGSAACLESIMCRLIDPVETDELRHELALIYADAEARQSLVKADRANVVWLRGADAPSATLGWAAQVEGIAATYGLRLGVLQRPDSDLEDASAYLRRRRPLLALVWDYDGRGSELEARMDLPSFGCPVERIYGDWNGAAFKAAEVFARHQHVAPPKRRIARTVAEAVRQAPSHDDVILLPAAYAGARHSVFRRPEDVYRAVGEVVAAVSNGALTAPGGLERALASSPFRYAGGVSATAHQEFAADYIRTYNGRSVMLGPHLKLGAGSREFCLRIYWYLDAEAHKVVIGHIGDHLPDAGS